MDLFPYTKARLRDVALQTPHYGDTARTPEILQREMLSVVFGWNDTVETLIREEMARHKPGSASNVLLAKWLSDMGADSMASLVGSESMTSSDWMLLALSSIGQDSQKKVGEAFVQRLLEKGDIHPAVAILLGLGEQDRCEFRTDPGDRRPAVPGCYPARVLNGSTISLSSVAGDHVCGVVVSRWFLWAFCGMGVKVVRESVKSGRKSRCFEIRAGSCVDK